MFKVPRNENKLLTDGLCDGFFTYLQTNKIPEIWFSFIINEIINKSYLKGLKRLFEYKFLTKVIPLTLYQRVLVIKSSTWLICQCTN